MGTTTGHNKLGPLTDAAADELTDHCQYQISFGQVGQSYNDTQWGLIVIEKNCCQAQGSGHQHYVNYGSFQNQIEIESNIN